MYGLYIGQHPPWSSIEEQRKYIGTRQINFISDLPKHTFSQAHNFLCTFQASSLKYIEHNNIANTTI